MTDLATVHLGQVIARLAGPGATPRDDQLEAVRALLAPQARVLVVQATGWGKSAVYWAATSALRASGAGPTLIVSPLLALMRDQVSAAQRAGLRAATINSTNIEDWDEVFAAIDAGTLDVLLVSPERLGNARFAARLDALLAAIGLVVIDEAHCISDWGFDFRPDYQRLARSLLRTPHAAVLATTATANERVTADVAAQLGSDAVTFRGTLARTSLRLSVVPGLTPLERYAWVADSLDVLEGSGIVYVLTVAEAERLAGFLAQRGHQVRAYTGSTEPAVRISIEEELRHNAVKAVVATSALGMGYDKPDLAFCLHVGSPATPVAYYQQVGRAGRALSNAEAVLLPAEADERIWDYFATASIPDPVHASAVLRTLEGGPRSQPELETITGIRRGRLEALLKILAVDQVVARNGSQWEATGLPYEHDHDKWAALAKVRAAEADLMRHYAHGDGCLMAFLQTALDDPSPAPCGRCSVCTGVAPGCGPRPSAAAIEAVRAYVRATDHVVEPRKLWPAGVSRKGKIAGLSAIRAVANADDPGWSHELAELRASGVIGPDLLAGAVATLTRWSVSWAARPVAFVVAPGTDTGLARTVADHLGTAGRLPVLDPFTYLGGPAPADSASVAVVSHLEGAIGLDPSSALPAGPVMLVAATMRSGWTLTVAGALLRGAGCTDVTALVLHRLP